MAKTKKVYVPVETQAQANPNDPLETDPVAPVTESYTTEYSNKKSFIDPTTGESIMLNAGDPIDPTMINEGETISPDPVIRYKDMVQRTKEMLMRRFSRKSTIVTGPMGLMSPTPVAYAGAFGITDGATSDQIIEQGADQGFVPLDQITMTPDEELESLILDTLDS
ncbi:MAG: hypothetical protein CMC27_01245 [Flavobacteriaceae bacterium]|nr:hypothetical protein [Flavobacteriaceae bacterium]